MSNTRTLAQWKEWNYEFIIFIQLLALFYTVYIMSHANKLHCAEHRG